MSKKPTDKRASDPMGLEKVNDVDLSKPPIMAIPDGVEVARTPIDLQNMIMRARLTGSDSIQCSEDMAKYILKHTYKPEIGFFIYQDVFVFEEGREIEVRRKMGMKMDDILFGHSTIREAQIPSDVESRPGGKD